MVITSKEIVVPKLYDENTLLLLHGDAIVDSSMYGQTITNSGVTVSADQSKFGGKSLYFDGSSHLIVPMTVSGDFTIDFWCYIKERLSGKTWVCPFHLTQGGSRGLLAYLVSNITYLCSASTNVTSSTVVGTGAWHHFAVVQQGNTAKLYMDGSLLLTVASASFTGDSLAIGYDVNSAGDTPLCGWIDEFRVSDIARWTENFTPPTEAYGGVVSGGTPGGGEDEPEEVQVITIKKSGSGTAGYAKVTIGGVTYQNATSVATSAAVDAICTVTDQYPMDDGETGIYVDGELIVGTGNQEKTVSVSPGSTIELVNGLSSSDYSYGQIYITTL